jgi:hypothetical protein
MDEVIFIGLVFFAVGIGIVWMLQVAKKTKLNWMLAARRLGLKYIPGAGLAPGALKGDFKGDHIRVEILAPVSNNQERATPNTAFNLRYGSTHPDWFVLSSRREEMPAESRGEASVQIGDPYFDDIVRVQCENRDRIASFFTRKQRRNLALAFLGNKHLVITNRGVKLLKDGTIKDAGLLILQTKALSRLADVVLARDNDSEEDGESTRHRKKARKHPKKRSRGKRVHGDTVESRGDDEPAEVEAKEEVEEVAGISPSGGGVPETTARVAPEVFVLDDFIEELFSGVSSLDAERIFDEKYRKRLVDLDGVLKAAGRFSFDLVFKDGPAVKASFLLKEVEGRYSRTKIRAVARFPESDLRKLKNSVGKKLAFSGTLIGVDTLLKTLVLGDAKVVGRR